MRKDLYRTYALTTEVFLGLKKKNKMLIFITDLESKAMSFAK